MRRLSFPERRGRSSRLSALNSTDLRGTSGGRTMPAEARERLSAPTRASPGDKDLKRMNPADAMQAGQVAHDLSLWGLFWNAHIIVKLVMVGLLAASVWCWAIIIDKTLLFARSKQAMDRFEDVFWS